MSATRARALRSVLREYPELLLIEDDHGHGIVDLPLHPLAGTTHTWVFVRSVAKAYGPDLRLAVLTGDPVTLDRVRGRQQLGAGWVARVLAAAGAAVWSDGAFRPGGGGGGLPRAPDLLIDALAERGVRAYGCSGLNAWIPVPDETGAVSRLLHAGWAVAPGARFRLNAPPGIRVTVATLTPDGPDRWRTRSPPPSARAWSGKLCLVAAGDVRPVATPARRIRTRDRDRDRERERVGVSLQDLVLGRARVSAAPARTIAAPTGADQLSDSPRIATPAAVATTGMKYVTI
ncbi:hypothetical protein SALBM311S_02944 [Streptomyces alboniger]